MKSFFLLFLVIILSATVQSFGQEYALEIHDARTGKDKVIKPNKRILIVTKDGERHKGRYAISDESHISVDGVSIALENVQRIRRDALGKNIAKWSIISLGLFYIGAAIVVSNGVGTAILTVFGGSLVGVGALLTNFLHSHKSKYNSYSIVNLKLN